MPSVLYHYTSAEGFLGILTGKRLWASDVRFLNDAEEISYAAGAVNELLRERADTISTSNDWQESLEAGQAMILRNAASVFDPERQTRTDSVWATCFCEDGDLLSQWRGYGEVGGGFAIGFRTSALRDLTLDEWPTDWPPAPVRLERVLYGLSNAKGRLYQVAQDAYDAARQIQNPAHPGMKGWDLGVRIVLPVLATIKNSGFAEEREWRVLWSGGSGGTPSNLHFRVSSIGIVPYTQLALPELTQAIAEVVVGPGRYPTLRGQGVHDVLLSQGLHSIDIRPSTCSFRA